MEPNMPLKLNHFFKVILSGAIEDGKLWIPKLFVRRYAEELFTSVTLEGPDGSKWPVELMKHDGEVSLENGWREFVSFYSIELGYFLVFRYEGNSLFHVLIFDRSATEVEYPSPISGSKEDDQCPASSSKEKSKGKKSKGKKGKSQTNGEGCSGGGAKSTRGHKSKVSKKNEAAPTSARSKSPRRARDLQYQIPPFKVTMSQSYISKHYMCLPGSFAERCKFRKQEKINLQGPGTRRWPVTYRYANYVGRHFPKLCKGWHAFVEANSLQIGDVCEFEQLIEADDFTLKVSIHRTG